MTYSIVARDPESGQMGVATQSQAFAVGSSVSWAMPGHGVIATQSMGEPMYGDLGLDMLRSGLTAKEALHALRSIDPHPERRQVAMVDSYGGVYVYTGDACVPEAGHCVGRNCAALANMMARSNVWSAMVDGYERTEGTLAERLVAALRRAEAEGGDVRGRRSAAIVVVREERSGRPWRDQVVDLRVDDHVDPVGELGRMIAYNARYHAVVEAFERALDGGADEAVERVSALGIDVEHEPELALWEAIVLGGAGRMDDARRVMQELAENAPQFVEAARRFRDVKLVEPELLDRILPPPKS